MDAPSPDPQIDTIAASLLILFELLSNRFSGITQILLLSWLELTRCFRITKDLRQRAESRPELGIRTNDRSASWEV